MAYAKKPRPERSRGFPARHPAAGGPAAGSVANRPTGAHAPASTQAPLPPVSASGLAPPTRPHASARPCPAGLASTPRRRRSRRCPRFHAAAYFRCGVRSRS